MAHFYSARNTAAFNDPITWSGAFANSPNNDYTQWSVKQGSINGSSLTFTSSQAQDDLPLLTAGRTETVKVTFKDLDPGQSVSVGGKTLLASEKMWAHEVALAFSNGYTGDKGSFDTDTMPSWSVLADSLLDAELTFQSLQANANADPLLITAQGRNEEVDVTFKALVPGQSVKIGDAELTALYDMSASQVTAAFNGQLNTNLGSMDGSVGNWTVKPGYVGQGTKLTFLSNATNTDVTNLAIALGGSTQQTGVVFEGLSAGQSVTIAGKTLRAFGTMSAEDVTADFFNITSGKNSVREVSGSLTDWVFAGVGSNYLLFQSLTMEAEVSPLPVVMTGSNESAKITFSALLEGQGITVAGWSLAALVDLDADQVASLFAGGNADGLATVSGEPQGWTLQAGYDNGNQLVFVSTTTEKDVDLISVEPFTTLNGVDLPDSPTIDTIPFVLRPAIFDAQALVVGVAPPDAPVVDLRNGASTPTAPDQMVTDGIAAPEDPGYELTIPLATHTESASPAVPGQFDILMGFNSILDRLELPGNSIMSGNFDEAEAGVTGLTISVSQQGIATFDGDNAGTASFEERVQAVLTAMGTETIACAFVMGNQQNNFDTFVLFGDGITGVQVTDTVVKLGGVAITDLSSILV